MRIVVAFLLGLPLAATTSIQFVQTTQSEALIGVKTDQTGCTIRASVGTSFVANIPDIIDNGNTESRTGTIGRSPGLVQFHLGKHAADDSLSQNTTYWSGFTCGSDAEVPLVFSTQAGEWGDTSGLTLPFNSAKFGNRDFPLLNYGVPDYQDPHVESPFGYRFFRAQGQGTVAGTDWVYLFQTSSQTPIDVNATGKWGTLASLVVNASQTTTPTQTVSASAGSGDPIFIPLNNFFFGCNGGWAIGCALDDIAIDQYCASASAAGVTFTYQLYYWTTALGSSVTSAACSTTSTANVQRMPGLRPAPPFTGWGLTNYPNIPNDMMNPTSGTLSCSSSVCTTTGTSPRNYFPIEYPIGAAININGTYYHVASVQSNRSFTLSESAVTVTSVSWKSAAFGIRVTHNGTGSAQILFGIDEIGSNDANWGQNADHSDLNVNSIQVGQNSDGSGPTVNANLRILTGPAGAVGVVAFVPYNADSSVRAESRIVSIGQLPTNAFSTQLVANGDTISSPVSVALNPSVSLNQGGPGNTIYGQGSDGRFYQITYTPSLHAGACGGASKYSAYGVNGGYNIYPITTAAGGTGANLGPDCFVYTNLTPLSLSPAMDFYSQMTRAFISGTNQIGQTVGQPHPNWDMTFLNTTASPELIASGYLIVAIGTFQNGPTILGAFSLTPDPSCNCLMLKYIRSVWGGEGDVEARWCGDHADIFLTGAFSLTACDPLSASDSTKPFSGPFEMPVNQVNLANYGSPPSWSGNPALTTGNVFNCPDAAHMPARYAAFAGTANCVQVEVLSPPCSSFPKSHTFPDGKTSESTEFPCVTPGFGNAFPAKSKLMDLTAGDWMISNQHGVGGEHFVALNIQWNSTSSGYVWLLRSSATNYTVPLFGVNGDSLQSEPSGGWTLQMVAPVASSSAGTAISFNLTVPTGPTAVLIDNPIKGGCHSTVTTGISANTFTWLNGCQGFATGGSNAAYSPTPSLSAASSVFITMTPTLISNPGFAGVSGGVGNNTNPVQSYPNGTNTPPIGPFVVQADYRALNGSSGSGGAENPSTFCGSLTLTLVGGTSHSYLITDPCSTSQNYKAMTFYGWAGAYIFKDISSPTTGNTTDLALWGMCEANATNECFQGSTAGNYYISMPSIDTATLAPVTNSFSSNAPAVTQLMGVSGKGILFSANQSDRTGGSGIKSVMYGQNSPGAQYFFSNARLSPQGDFLFTPCFWCNGHRNDWLVYYMGNQFQQDGVNRSGFVQSPVTDNAPTDADHAEVLFGYLENGGNLLNCKPRNENCTTRFPGSAPFGFIGESGLSSGVAVSAGTTTVNIPVLSNHIAYYMFRWRKNGAVISSSEVRAMAVP